jgi:hypothetical protein
MCALQKATFVSVCFNRVLAVGLKIIQVMMYISNLSKLRYIHSGHIMGLTKFR